MKDRSYLEALVRSVTVLTGAQVRRSYFENDAQRMRLSLRAHQAAGLITISTELVRPRISDAPLAVIERGKCQPSPQQLAYLADKRWSREILPTVIIRGTAKLAALCGGQVRTFVSGHLSHEVALADIFLTKRSVDPAFEWTLVHAAPGLGALPDAIAGETAIELLGRYNGTTVAAKLAISAACRLELW